MIRTLRNRVDALLHPNCLEKERSFVEIPKRQITVVAYGEKPEEGLLTDGIDVYDLKTMQYCRITEQGFRYIKPGLLPQGLAGGLAVNFPQKDDRLIELKIKEDTCLFESSDFVLRSGSPEKMEGTGVEITPGAVAEIQTDNFRVIIGAGEGNDNFTFYKPIDRAWSVTSDENVCLDFDGPIKLIRGFGGEIRIQKKPWVDYDVTTGKKKKGRNVFTADKTKRAIVFLIPFGDKMVAFGGKKAEDVVIIEKRMDV